MQVNIFTFNQSRYPRFGKDSLLPLARSYNADKSLWCVRRRGPTGVARLDADQSYFVAAGRWGARRFPPGHGDVYESLYRSGVLDALIRQGKEYVFISNVDNLGATVDLSTSDWA